jgi:exonuclease V
MTLDSDNEFGYDFSAEEEELLLQLSAENNNVTNNAEIAAIDSVPERHDSVHPQNVADGTSSTSGVDRLQTGSTNNLYRGKAFHQLDTSSGVPTPPPALSSIEDVLYPDCT